MKVICFSGALRAGSVSKQLVQEAARLLSGQHGVTADYVDLKEFPFPVYDSDIEQSIGIPDTILRLAERVRDANALVIASPEYNGGISSVLKTLVDWLSRVKPSPLTGKFLLLLSASPSGTGGVAGLWHTRVPFEALGVHVFPHMVAVPRAQNAFSTDGQLTDPKSEQKLREVVGAFVRHVSTHHPIARRALGEEGLQSLAWQRN
jgi:NAD(P)H-dependent FMN reductase